MAKRKLQAGDIVRVARNEDSGLVFGALVRIGSLGHDKYGPFAMVGALEDGKMLPVLSDDWSAWQHVLDTRHLKYAKQANRFDQRRG